MCIVRQLHRSIYHVVSPGRLRRCRRYVNRKRSIFLSPHTGAFEAITHHPPGPRHQTSSIVNHKICIRILKSNKSLEVGYVHIWKINNHFCCMFAIATAANLTPYTAYLMAVRIVKLRMMNYFQDSI